MRLADWKKLEGHMFRACRFEEQNGAAIPMTLTTVADRGSSERMESYSLYFAGPKEPFIPQGMIKLEHDAFEEPIVIFIVPIEQRQDGFGYEAVFNTEI